MLLLDVSCYAHVSVSLMFMENAVRYCQIFDQKPDLITDTLGAFVDQRGIHHPEAVVHERAAYLLHRLAKSLLKRLNPYIESILTSMQDLLVIKQDATTMAEFQERSNKFTNQLYLFETVGMLISIEREKQAVYLKVRSPCRGCSNRDSLFADLVFSLGNRGSHAGGYSEHSVQATLQVG
jgi:exportin-T